MNAKSTSKLNALDNIPQILKISPSAAWLLTVNVKDKHAKASVSLALSLFLCVSDHQKGQKSERAQISSCGFLGNQIANI